MSQAAHCIAYTGFAKLLTALPIQAAPCDAVQRNTACSPAWFMCLRERYYENAIAAQAQHVALHDLQSHVHDEHILRWWYRPEA